MTFFFPLLFHSAGVPGKETPIQLTSKALMKKSTDMSLQYDKGSTIIETAPETDETLQQVIHSVCQIALMYIETKTEHE